MSLKERYQQLSSPLRKQLAELQPKFEKRKNVQAEYTHLIGRKYNKHNEKYALRLAMLKVLDPLKIIRTSYFPSIWCYDDRGERVTFTKMLHQDEHVRVAEGISKPSLTPVVIKWYQSGRKDVKIELDMYNKMKSLGAPVPYFSTRYQFFDREILVMEKLQPITKKDDEFEMARQVIAQLRILHTFSVHNDLKPGNIMKRSQSTSSPTNQGNQVPEYFIIDYGGCATQRLGHGWRRSCWTPYTSSQMSREKNQITTAKNDLIELGYTMKALQNIKKGVKGKVRFGEKGNDLTRTGFTGKLEQYMNRVYQVDEHNITPKDYDDLLTILSS